MGNQKGIHITPVTKQFEEAARQLILTGLKERFGFLDPSYNLDLISIIQSYNGKGEVFLVGLHNNELLCTGALIKERSNVGRIQRMSVKQTYRRAGLAKLMIQALEIRAREEGYNQVVLETNNSWHSAIEFYKNRGYQLKCKDKERSHFVKKLV